MSATTQMDVTYPENCNDSTSWIAKTLRRLYAGQPHATKMIARRAAKDPRAVKEWLAGKTAPSSESFIDLLVAHEEFEAELAILIRERRKKCGF